MKALIPALIRTVGEAPRSDSIACLPNKKNVGRDQDGHDEHPVLDFKAQNGEMLDKKSHRRLLFLVQDGDIGIRNIFFVYFFDEPMRITAAVPRGFCRRMASARDAPAHNCRRPDTAKQVVRPVHAGDCQSDYDDERSAGLNDSNLSNSGG
jgi:hypothetical protein